MTSFKCPHNEQVHILKSCPIIECPFHYNKVSMFFTVEKQDTNCVYYDSDIMTNVSDNRTQISALSRDSRRTVSPKAFKESYDDALSYIRTKIHLVHDIASTKHSCKFCGIPVSPKQIQCVSVSACSSRKDWLKYVVSLYGVDNNLSTYQLIWELLFKDKIHLEEQAKYLGYSLCPSKLLSEAIKAKMDKHESEKLSMVNK